MRAFCPVATSPPAGEVGGSHGLRGESRWRAQSRAAGAARRVASQADYHHTAIERGPDVVSPLGRETGLHSWRKEAPRSQVASIVRPVSWAHFPGLGPWPRGMTLHRPVLGTVLGTLLSLPRSQLPLPEAT